MSETGTEAKKRGRPPQRISNQRAQAAATAGRRRRITRQLLRMVDHALLHYGPRRAKATLVNIRGRIPHGGGAAADRYEQWLADMLERDAKVVSDYEAADAEHWAAPDKCSRCFNDDGAEKRKEQMR